MGHKITKTLQSLYVKVRSNVELILFSFDCVDDRNYPKKSEKKIDREFFLVPIEPTDRPTNRVFRLDGPVPPWYGPHTSHHRIRHICRPFRSSHQIRHQCTVLHIPTRGLPDKAHRWQEFSPRPCTEGQELVLYLSLSHTECTMDFHPRTVILRRPRRCEEFCEKEDCRARG